MIFITGASSGLGASLAKLYGNNGEDLLLTGRNEQRLSLLAENISGNVKIKPADLSSSEDISFLFDSINEIPQTVIHCAGSGYFGPIDEQEPNSIKSLIDNNITSAVFLLRELVKRYKKKKVNVVFVISTAAQTAKSGESTYCAVKWAVRGLIESVRLELKGFPMNIIGVYPGGMATDFWQTSGKKLDTSTFMTSDEAALMLKKALISTEHGFVSDISINRL